jgi:hypothetical protein
MQASRLVRIAKDILDEYRKFGIIQLLNEASQLSAQRGAQNDSQYNQNRQNLINRARKVVDETHLRLYPEEIQQVLDSSTYANALPDRLARIIVSGFPAEKDSAITSAELNTARSLAERGSGELQALVNAANNFHIDNVDIPKDMVSLDVIPPTQKFR